MVDAEPVDETLAHPPHDLGVRLVEHPRHLDADAGQGRHREEPAVVELVVGPPPVDELPMLLHRPTPSLPGAIGSRSSPRSSSSPSRSQAPAHRRRAPAAAPCRRRTPSRRRTPPRIATPAELQQIPPPRILVGGPDAHVIRDDVRDRRRGPARARRRTAHPAPPPRPGRVDPRRVDDVVAVVGARRRLAVSSGDRYTAPTPRSARYGTSRAAANRSKPGRICSR